MSDRLIGVQQQFLNYAKKKKTIKKINGKKKKK